MFRRAVFALMLIGAAFAGGAAINGPGLAWLQRNFATGRSIIVDVGSSKPPADRSSPRPFPTASTPPLIVPPPRPQAAPKKKAEAVATLAQADPPLLPESPSTPSAALAPLPGPAEPEAESPIASLAALAPPAQGGRPVSPTPTTLPPLDPGPAPKSDPVARLASVERPEPSPSSSKDWAGLRKRMKALGVARYTIESETEGRVRFSCVIPVEGLKAVGHHFEAEGDDEYQAADAALKRVSLWKATTQD